MKKILLFFFTLALFAGCHKSSQGNKDELATQDLTLKSPALKSPVANETMDKAISDTSATSSQIILQGAKPISDWDKKIIKTAFLKLEVKDFKTYSNIVHQAAKQYGGYVANEEQNQSEEKIESTIFLALLLFYIL